MPRAGRHYRGWTGANSGEGRGIRPPPSSRSRCASVSRRARRRSRVPMDDRSREGGGTTQRRCLYISHGVRIGHDALPWFTAARCGTLRIPVCRHTPRMYMTKSMASGSGARNYAGIGGVERTDLRRHGPHGVSGARHIVGRPVRETFADVQPTGIVDHPRAGA